MGEVSGNRTGYHHGDLRNALVDAALELARGGGPEAVVLRAAARRVGVSPTAAYRHFTSQAELLQVVRDEGQDLLAASMEAHVRSVETASSGPVEAAKARLMAIGRGYVRFATAEPGLYRTAFCRMPPGRPDPGDGAAAIGAARSFGMLMESLDELQAAGALRPGVREGAEFAAWSAVHGLSMLILDGPLDQLPPGQRETAVQRALDMVLDGLTR